MGKHVLGLLAADPSVELSWTRRVEAADPGIDGLPAPMIFEDLETIDLARLADSDVIIDLVSRGRGRMVQQRDINLRIRGHCRLIDGLVNLNSTAHYILVSSGGAIYGNSSEQILRETTLVSPNTEYGLEKAIVEMHLRTAESTGLRPSILRVANAYGNGQVTKPGFGVIPTLVYALKSQTPFKVLGTGDARRDYVNVIDIVGAISNCLRLERTGTFNIGTGIGTSINELIKIVETLTGRTVDIENIESTIIEPGYSQLDISHAAQVLDWAPLIRLEDGLRLILQDQDLVPR